MSKELTRLKEFCLIQAISTPGIMKEQVVEKAKEYLAYFTSTPAKKPTKRK